MGDNNNDRNHSYTGQLRKQQGDYFHYRAIFPCFLIQLFWEILCPAQTSAENACSLRLINRG